tara:strand:- start:145 stop:924 length:780 start_codon:yes stop_codon:yes gene_type:complete
MILATDQFFNSGWIKNETGLGSVTTNSVGVLTCNTGDAGSRALNTYDFPAFGGDVVKFSVMARLITAPSAGYALVRLESPRGGVTGSNIEIWQTDWRLYETKYTVPEHLGKVNIAINLGAAFNNSHVEFARPKIEFLSGQLGTLRTVASGRIGISSNATVITESTGYKSTNIATMTWNAGVKRIDISLSQKPDFNDGGVQYKPIILISSPYNAVHLNYVTSSIDDSGGFSVTAFDDSGVVFDFATTATLHEFDFEMRSI